MKDGSNPPPSESEALETLRIQVKHLRNDYEVTRGEYETAARGYLDTLARVERQKRELEESNRRLREAEARAAAQRSAIARLVVDPVVIESNETRAAARIACEASSILQARVGIWRFSDDGIRLHCLAQCETGPLMPAPGDSFDTQRIPRYIDALRNEHRICTDDVQADPRTCELAKSGMLSPGISSRMDAGVFVEGRLAGLVCIEQAGAPRTWHTDEALFADTLAALVAQHLVNAKRRRAEEALQKRSLYESYVADACALLLSNPDGLSDRRLIDETLALLRQVASTHRAYVFENREDPVDGLCMLQTHEVCADGIRPEIDNPALSRLPYRNGYDRWRRELSQGHCIQGPVAAFPPEERPLLESQDIASILVLPVHGGGVWRGFIGFDYLNEPREWDQLDVKLLETAADVIGGFLHAAELRAHLREERDRYERTVGLISDNVWSYSTDAGLRFVESYIAPSMDRLLHLPPGTIGNDFDTFFSHVHPDDLPRLKAKLADGLANRTAHDDIEYRVRDGQDHERWFLSKGSVVAEPNGHLVVFGTTSDITRRKLAEERLHETNLRLEASMARANELAREARAASEAKGRFLMQMSHEIRTPMNAVLGMADLLEISPLSSEQLECLRTLQTAGQHLLGVINDILDYSKLESRCLQLEDRPFEIRPLADNCAMLFAARPSALEISARVAPDVPPFIQGDEQRLRQVLINLMGNAIKFTEKGGVYLDIQRTPDNRLCFAVRDTGIGIPEDQISQVFQRFFQTDYSMTRRYGGTGLGLAITREIVELMGGEIQIDSQVGRGSVFSVFLPLRPADLAEPVGRTLDVTAPAPPPASPDLPALSVLLAEDLEVNRKMFRMFLRGQPVRLVEAVNGQEAVELCARQRFDLVLMDVEMPVMDGLTAMRRIREDECAADVPPVPIFALTAHAMAEQAEQCRLAGAQKIITKPVRMKALLDAVHGVAHDKATPRQNHDETGHCPPSPQMEPAG